jgi:hypothetical protein
MVESGGGTWWLHFAQDSGAARDDGLLDHDDAPRQSHPFGIRTALAWDMKTSLWIGL